MGLSKSEVERMVREAEEFAAEDAAMKDKVSAKNDLENTLYSFKNAVDDEKLAALIDESDKTAVTTACDDALSWLDSNANAEASEFKAKLSEVEAVVKPIMAKVQAAAWCCRRYARWYARRYAR